MSIEAALKTVSEQDAALILPTFDEAVALDLGMAAVKLAQSEGKAIYVNVSRGLHTLFQHSMVGTTPANDDFAMRKRAVVDLMGFSSITFWLHNQNGFDFKGFMNLPEREYGSYGGSIPLKLDNGGYVGSLTVSGLSDIDDHNFASRVLAAHLGVDFTPVAL